MHFISAIQESKHTRDNNIVHHSNVLSSQRLDISFKMSLLRLREILALNLYIKKKIIIKEEVVIIFITTVIIIILIIEKFSQFAGNKVAFIALPVSD